MKILFGVFDWGLGHATRDLPIIKALLKEKNQVDILSTGRALKLLKNSFGDKCRYFDVSSIFVPYGKDAKFTKNFVLNVPKMAASLKKARRITKKIIQKNNYDKVISDCRYDVYDKKENSFLINHQVRFKSNPVFQKAMEWWLAQRMKKYKLIFVPDYAEENLTGILSHDLLYTKKSKIRYVGILSQLEKRNMKKDIDYLISISGPEPQRTVLEEKIMPNLHLLKGKIIIALGKPESNLKSDLKNVKIFGFLNSKKQEEMMNRAKFIICRSGYTTMMEFAELEIKKALIIPTPGQTEQEYLADLYEEKGNFHHVDQDCIDLKKDIETARKFSGFPKNWKTKYSVKLIIEEIKQNS